MAAEGVRPPPDNVRPLRPKAQGRAKAAPEPLMPSNVEAEQAALGSILIDPDALPIVSETVGLVPADFYRDAHRTIYQAMQELHKQGVPVDLITLTDELERTGKLEDIGGASEVGALANNVPSPANVEHYARIIRRTAACRRLIEASQHIAESAYSDPADVDGLVEYATQLVQGAKPQVETERASRFRLIPDDEVERMPQPEMLIGGWLLADTLALIYGDTGTYKSFLALDMAEHIATGRAWQGHPVKQGPVVYIAAEGASGFSKRIRAWKAYHQVAGFTGLYLIKQAVQFLAPDQVQEAIREIGKLATPPMLVIADTLGRSMDGGKEQDNSDMHRVVSAADTIRHAFGCTVLLVHHEGKDASLGPRGASALRDDVDTTFALSRSGKITTVRCTKQKEIEEPPDFHFSLRGIALDEHGDETSCVIEPVDVRPASAPADLLPSERTTLSALHGHPEGIRPADWRKMVCVDGDMVDRTFWRAKAKLEQAGYVTTQDGRYFLTTAGLEVLT